MKSEDSTVEALAEAWWQRCQAHRCASGRADADERELLLNALGDRCRRFLAVVRAIQSSERASWLSDGRDCHQTAGGEHLTGRV